MSESNLEKNLTDFYMSLEEMEQPCKTLSFAALASRYLLFSIIDALPIIDKESQLKIWFKSREKIRNDNSIPENIKNYLDFEITRRIKHRYKKT